MAKTIASGVGMTNAWLAAQGVLSLKTLWAELAQLRYTAGCGPACPVVWGGWPEMATLTRFVGSCGQWCQFVYLSIALPLAAALR